MASYDAARLVEFLRPPRIAVLATVGRTGMPQITPAWYRFEGGRLTVAASAESVKARNLRRDPRLSVCVYSDLKGEQYAALYGRAELTEGDYVWPETRAIVERYVEPDGVDEWMRDLMQQEFVLIGLEPERVVFGP